MFLYGVLPSYTADLKHLYFAVKTPRWRRVPRAAPTQRHSLQWSLWNAFGLGSLSENPHPTALGIWLESHGFHIDLLFWSWLNNHDHRLEKKWQAFRHANHVPVLILRESKAFSKMNVNQGMQFPCKGQCWRQAMETTPGFEGLKHGTCNRTIHVAMPGNFRRDAARISAQWLNTTQLPGVDSPWSQGCKGEKKQGFKLRKLIIRDYQRYYSSTIVYEVSTSTPKTPDRKFVSPHLSGPMVFRL